MRTTSRNPLFCDPMQSAQQLDIVDCLFVFCPISLIDQSKRAKYGDRNGCIANYRRQFGGATGAPGICDGNEFLLQLIVRKIEKELSQLQTLPTYCALFDPLRERRFCPLVSYDLQHRVERF